MQIEGTENQLPGRFSQGSPDFLVKPFGPSCFEQLGGRGECRENVRGMFYGVWGQKKVHIRCIGRPCCQVGQLGWPRDTGNLPHQLTRPPFPLHTSLPLLSSSPLTRITTFELLEAMSTKVVFAKVLLRCEEATLDKEGSEGGKIGVVRTMGDKQ